MEESNQASNSMETSPMTPPAGVEETAVTVPQPKPLTTFTKVDNNLTSIGFFTASSKRSRKAIEKTSVVIDQGIEHRISILPSAKYGMPITQDQDFWLALMLLVEDHRRRHGTLKNPFTFTTAELTKILGQAHSGKNYKAVEEWLAVMASTTIEGGAYNAVKKSWMTKRTHAVETTITIGKELPDGTIADKNHIWFSEWQLDNINAGNLIAIELNTYTQLENNISKNLVPHLQEWLYASQRDGRFEKQYEDICQLLGIRTYRYRSDIDRQLRPSLDELVLHGYLSEWAIEPMSTQKAYKLVLWHGHKYHSDRQARLDRNPRTKSESKQLPAAQPEPEQYRRPRQKPLPLKPEVNPEYLAALTSRGVSETHARKLLAELPADFSVLDTLEYGDAQLATQGSRIQNPPGFYISLLRERTTPPPTFETSEQKRQRQAAILAQEQAIQEEAATVFKREEKERAAMDAALDRLQSENPEQWQIVFAQAQTEVFSHLPEWMRAKPAQYSSVHEPAIRSRMRKLLQENPHYATKEAPRQATPLPEVSTPSPLLNLEAFLSTPLLKAPPEPAPATPEEPRQTSTTVDTHLL